MIKYNKNEDSFFIDRKRNMIYEVGFLDLKAFSLNDKLQYDEINKLMEHIKPLMNNARDRNTINTDKYQFYFNNFLHQEVLKFRILFKPKKQLTLLV